MTDIQTLKEVRFTNKKHYDARECMIDPLVVDEPERMTPQRGDLAIAVTPILAEPAR